MTSKREYAKEELKKFQSKIGKELEYFFNEERKRVKEQYDNKYSDKVLQTFAEFTMNKAKRLRGSFVYYTYKMLEGKNDSDAMKAAVAIEMIHSYLLIEDDFMDLSPSRRGEPTAHIILEDYHRENFTKGDPEHIGVSLALLSSLMGSHMAMELINSIDTKPEILKKANLNINRCLNVTVHGQINDVVNELKDDVEEVDIFNVLKWKTSIYTYENPIHLGAILAGADESELTALSKYAIPAGIAFQIQDDILGTFGNPEKTGKSNMDDIKEGKATLLTYMVNKNGNKEQRRILENALGNKDLTEKELKEVQLVMVDTGSYDYSKEKAQNYVTDAKKKLLEVKYDRWNDEGLNYLIGIADYMIERNL